MCGLFGFITEKSGVESRLPDARRARDTLIHRGPDQAGEWYDDQVYIGHRRLSIIDLSDAGRQPMVSRDGQIIIAVNGEIYNFKSLRAELEAKGATFTSGSDSEVILNGYHYWGLDTLLDKIDGMYAFSIYDVTHGKLHLARDRAGIKPLYYGQVGGVFTWGSELKALTAFYGESNLTADHTALYDFLTYRYVPSPKSCYKNISKLPPAHVLSFDVASGKTSTRRYWHLPVSNAPIDHDEAAEKLRSLLAQSVNEQMVADVPVGFFLSGGVDSSAIVAHARALGHNANTFSIGFGVEGYDETIFAEQVAQHLGTHHQTDIITPHLDVPFAAWILNLYDEPFADNSALPTWYVAGHARKAATVVLTGDGGDELFGGYKWYGNLHYLNWGQMMLRPLPKKTWRFMPHGRLRKKLEILSSEADILAAYNDLYFTKTSHDLRKNYREKLEIPNDYDPMWLFREYWRPEKMSLRKAAQYLDFHTFLPEDILTKVDRATMAHSLEARIPFLSRDLIEFAFSLPEDFLYKDKKLKGGLKYAHRNMLPVNILNRTKRGFTVPWKIWSKTLVGNTRGLCESQITAFLNK